MHGCSLSWNSRCTICATYGKRFRPTPWRAYSGSSSPSPPDPPRFGKERMLPPVVMRRVYPPRHLPICRIASNPAIRQPTNPFEPASGATPFVANSTWSLKPARPPLQDFLSMGWPCRNPKWLCMFRQKNPRWLVTPTSCEGSSSTSIRKMCGRLSRNRNGARVGKGRRTLPSTHQKRHEESSSHPPGD